MFNAMLNLAEGLLIMGDERIAISMTRREIDTTFDLELKADADISPRSVQWVSCVMVGGRVHELTQGQEVEVSEHGSLSEAVVGDDSGMAAAQRLVIARGLGSIFRDDDGDLVVAVSVGNLLREKVALTKGTKLASGVSGVEDHITMAIQEGDAEGALRYADAISYGDAGGGLADSEIERMVNGADAEGMDDEKRSKLAAHLRKNKDVFAPSLAPPGASKHIPHRIDTQGHAPIKCTPIRTSRAEMFIEKEEVGKMHKAGVVRPSFSPWAFPVVLVRKKDGTTRFCVDYRQLNKITKKDSYPLPRIEDILDGLQGSLYRSVFDLVSGYWQIPVEPSDIEKTAFTTRSCGTWEFTVMPFGLSNAPATFQRDMDLVLSGLTWVCTLVYMDDIIVYSPTFEQHLLDMDKVFERLRDANMFIKPSKCFMCKERLPFLGHIVSNEGVSPDPGKTEAVHKMPRPSNATEVRMFLGLTNYYRRFVRGYAEMAAPLNALTSKAANHADNFIWSPKCEVAFVLLKQALTTAPVLAFPDYSRPFELYTDASRVAIGAVLSQRDNEHREHVVAYASRKLDKAEANYGVTELEFLSVVVWVQHFHPYLHGERFKLFTDHQPLKGLIDSSSKQPAGRRARWILLLQPYSFDIIYKADKAHINADTMSRLVLCGPDGGVSAVPESSVLLADGNAAGDDFVATVDRPRREAAVKGAIKVRQWVTNPYADLAPTDERCSARAVKIRPEPSPSVIGTHPFEVADTSVEESGAGERSAGEKTRDEHEDGALEEDGQTLGGSQRAKGGSPDDSHNTGAQDFTDLDGLAVGDDQHARPVEKGKHLHPHMKERAVGTDHTTCPPPNCDGGGVRTTPGPQNDLLQQVSEGQRKDKFLREIITYLELLELPDEASRAKRIATEAAQCFLRNGTLYRAWWPQRGDVSACTRVQLAVPVEMREAVMMAHHDDLLAGHLGVNRTTDALRRLYWWPGMYADIERWVLECMTCQGRKSPAERKKGLMQPMPAPSRAFQRIGMDLITSFPTSTRGNKYLLVFMDYLTKWPEAVALPNKKADTVARAFVEHVICRHGAPESLLSDRGKEFVNRVLKEVNMLLKISKLNTSPYHPQTDGMVERFNGTIENMLSKVVSDDQKDWDTFVPYVLFAYRSTVHEVTGESPFFLMYG